MGKISKRTSQALLIVILGLLILSIADFVFKDGSVFLNNVLDYAKTHNTALSVLLSALLFTVYLMQYFIQNTQTDLASRQERLMRAGYTPIVGVKDREWGKKREEGTDMETFEANKYYLQLMNNGNSAARNLRLWIGIAYDVPDNQEIYYSSNEVPLQRTDEGTWWPTDVGGALSETAGEATEFVARPKVVKMEGGWFLIDDSELEVVDIGDALQSIHGSVEEVSLAFSVKYTTTTGDDQEITIGVIREKLSKLNEVGWTLYDAQEGSSDEFEEIKQKAH
jgi:hypothetical protein